MRSGRWKLLSMVLTGVLLLSACGSGESVQNAAFEEAPAADTEESVADTEEQAAATGKDETEEQTADTGKEESASKEKESGMVIPDVSIEPKEIPASDAMEFVKNMKVGWNLGNTLEAHNGANPGDELSTETCWGNPETTKEMIDAVKEAGFNTVRVPVTWYNHTQKNADGSYTVSEVWLDRVQEVVDYAYDNGMYVILNTHHDVSMDDGYYPDSAHYEQSEKFLKSVWTVMAERFRDYDEHLILESLNGPRLAGTEYEWNFAESSAECKDSADCINRLNQLFVDTVRADGGKNAERYLMVPGYDASPAGALSDLFVLPQDSVEDKLIISTHAYIPYNFALQSPSEGGSTEQFSADSVTSRMEIDTTLDKLYKKYVSQGIPVVMGEFGARNKNNNLQQRVDYYAYYIAAARARGISCCIWDNGSFGGNGEQFGVLRRTKVQWIFPDIVEAIMKYA